MNPINLSNVECLKGFDITSNVSMDFLTQMIEEIRVSDAKLTKHLTATASAAFGHQRGYVLSLLARRAYFQRTAGYIEEELKELGAVIVQTT